METPVLLVVLGLYAATLVAVGLAATRRSSRSPEEFFLAGRKLGPLVLFMALFGTNATSFVLVGIPGRAYHDGIGVFGLNAPVVALFTPLTFFLIGVPARRMAIRLNAVTPAELYAKRFGSPAVGMLLFAFFLAFTLPYMVVAVKGAAVTLAEVTDGRIPFAAAAAGVIVVALVYTTLGGMRATAWTNVLQGSIFLVFLVVALGMILASLGGPREAMQAVARHDPSLLAVDPDREIFSPRHWGSWALLISMTVVAFPHMFVRILAAESERALAAVCRLYPIALAVLWLPPVLIGLFGAVEFPGLTGRESDQIYALRVERHLPAWLAAVGFLAVLAAVMSTLDAQILTLGSMLTRDVLDRLRPGRAAAAARASAGASNSTDRNDDVGTTRVFGAVVAGAVFVLSLTWGQSVFQIASVAFSGYVTLTPALWLGVTWKRFNRQGMMASILVGNAVLFLGLAGVLPTFGFLPVAPAWVAAWIAAIVVAKRTPPPSAALGLVAFGFARKR